MRPNPYLRKVGLLIIIVIACNSAHAQFETTLGNLAGSEETADIKPLSNGHFIVLATTTGFGTKKILLTELTSSAMSFGSGR